MSEDDDTATIEELIGSMMAIGAKVDVIGLIVGTLAERAGITEDDVREFANFREDWKMTKDAQMLRVLLHPTTRYRLGSSEAD